MNKEVFQKLVGERIFESRKKKGERGMTQSEFAEAIGKSLSSVQKYESGDIDIPLSMLYSISEVLNVTVSYLTNCQQPYYPRMDNLADVMALLIELNNKEELPFDIEVGEKDGVRSVSLTFSGTKNYIPLLCNFLETLKRNCEALEKGYIDNETFNAWAENVIAKNQTVFLNNREQSGTDKHTSTSATDNTSDFETKSKTQSPKSQVKKKRKKSTDNQE